MKLYDLKKEIDKLRTQDSPVSDYIQANEKDVKQLIISILQLQINEWKEIKKNLGLMFEKYNDEDAPSKIFLLNVLIQNNKELINQLK